MHTDMESIKMAIYLCHSRDSREILQLLSIVRSFNVVVSKNTSFPCVA